MKDIKELCAQVRQISHDIHVYHGPGHLEKSRFELRKFAWSQEAARRKSKPSFLFSALSLRSLRSLRFNRRRILSCAQPRKASSSRFDSELPASLRFQQTINLRRAFPTETTSRSIAARGHHRRRHCYCAGSGLEGKC